MIFDLHVLGRGEKLIDMKVIILENTYNADLQLFPKSSVLSPPPP